MRTEEEFLRIALAEAKSAEWPFGAVLVRAGEIIAKAGSGGDTDPTAHAEVNVIRKAAEELQTSNLSGTVLYASCEPCSMCFSAVWYAGIREIVFGSFLSDLQNIGAAWGGDLVFPEDHLAKTGIKMRGGVLRNEIIQMYTSHHKVSG